MTADPKDERITELLVEIEEWRTTVGVLNARIAELEANEAEVLLAQQFMREKGVLR